MKKHHKTIKKLVEVLGGLACSFAVFHFCTAWFYEEKMEPSLKEKIRQRRGF